MHRAHDRLHNASEGVQNLEVSESPWGGPSQELQDAQKEFKSAKAEVSKQLKKLGVQPEAHAPPPEQDRFDARESRARFAPPRPADPVAPPPPAGAHEQADALRDLLQSNSTVTQLRGLQQLSPRLLRELEQLGSAARRDPRLEALLVAASRPGPARIKARLRLHPDKLLRLTQNLSPSAKAEVEAKAETLWNVVQSFSARGAPGGERV